MNKKICDTEKLNKILKYNYKFSKSREYKKENIINRNNYDKKIKHPELYNKKKPSFIKTIFISISIIILILFLVYYFSNITLLK